MSVKFHLTDKQTNVRVNKQTDTMKRIWCILALNVKSGGNNFNDLPDNQLTKFRVFIGRSRIFIPSKMSIIHRTLFSHRMGSWQTQTDNWTNEQTGVSVCPLDGVWHSLSHPYPYTEILQRELQMSLMQLIASIALVDKSVNRTWTRRLNGTLRRSYTYTK